MYRRQKLGLYAAVISAAIFFYAVPAWAVNMNIKAAVNPNIPPYQFMDEHGDCVGIHIDILDNIASKHNLSVEYLVYENDVDCLNALEQGEVDVILGMQTQIPAEYNFAQVGDLSSSVLCIVVANDTARMIQDNNYPYYYFTVVVDFSTNLTIARAHLDQTDFGKTMRLIVSNTSQVFAMLRENKAQLAVADKENVIYYLNSVGASEDYTIINNHLTSVNYTMLVHRNDRSLQRMLQTGLSSLHLSGEYELIWRKWIKDTSKDVPKIVFRYVSVFIVVAMVYVIISQYIRKQLKKKVDEQTRELKLTNDELEERMIELQEAQEIQASLIKHSPSGMIMFDKNHIIQLYNFSAQQIVGEQELLVGADIRSYMIFRKILQEVGEDVFSSFGRIMKWPVQTSFREGGQKKDIRYILYNPFEHGARNSVLMVVEDVTVEEKERKEQEDAEKHKSLNMLIAGIAHEIKNPLMTIQTYTSSIPRQIDNPNFRESLIKYIPLEVSRINKLIEGLINYARPVKGKAEKLDVETIINEALYLIQATIKDKPFEMSVKTQKNIFILANKDKMKQAIINLATNSIESIQKKLLEGHQGKKLAMCIFLNCTEKKVYIHIEDEGVGMTETEIRHCTDPFFTNKSAGTGLGMSLAKQFVKESNGNMLIEGLKGEYTKITLEFERVVK